MNYVLLLIRLSTYQEILRFHVPVYQMLGMNVLHSRDLKVRNGNILVILRNTCFAFLQMVVMDVTANMDHNTTDILMVEVQWKYK